MPTYWQLLLLVLPVCWLLRRPMVAFLAESPMTEELAAMTAPVLVVAGDEDNGVLETDLMLKRTIPRCGLAILPRLGHVTNLEEPELFNELVQRFMTAVEHEAWTVRDPRTLSTSTVGTKQ